MSRYLRRSLLGQLLGVYLLFVSAVLGTGLVVSAIIQDRLRTGVQASDLALAQAIALETGDSLRDARDSLQDLAALPAVRTGNLAAMSSAFGAFKVARKDVDRVYWLDPQGIMRVSVPGDVRTRDEDLGETPVFQRARDADAPILEAGLVDLTTFNAVVTVAEPVRDDAGHFRGVVATNLLLDDLSAPLRTVAAEQQQRGHSVMISMIDDQGQLIATLERERLLQPALSDMPGAAEALAGQPSARVAAGPQGQQWLFTSTSVPGSGWAVVVQRPTREAMAVVDSFTAWLWAAAALFGVGGLFFWMVLVRRVIHPLHALAIAHQSVLSTPSTTSIQMVNESAVLSKRADEVGDLARAFALLEHDVTMQLTELRTLLDTSTAVVSTLDPRTVAEALIHEVSRLVDVQAAAVRVPDQAGVLHVLASVGRSPNYERTALVSADDPVSPALRALREGRPVQMVAGEGREFPALSYQEGFRALLAIPIISPRVGGVVLLVHRTQPQPFTEDEVGLLLTFANYATLAWEHAVLYERSDEHLQEIASENELLYRRTMEEKQTLAAIMGSMSDGLVLTGVDGALLYANPGAGAITGINVDALTGVNVNAVHAVLREAALDPDAYDRARADAESGAPAAWLVETGGQSTGRTIQVRLFDVYDEAEQVMGRGLLLRDVTREQEIDRFKSTLLAAVGHEIRTPLTAIKGYASTLLQDDVTWSPDDQHHFLQTISDETDRLAELVSNLLDLSRYEAGLLPLTRQPARVADLVARAAARMNPLASKLTVEIDPSLPLIEVDGPRIEIVLHNLLSNARAYGSEAVGLSADAHGDEVAIHITNNGPAITDDELPHIFERFYRARSGKQHRSEGTGLGLAICKAFVEAHGGAIWAESGPSGTMVSFTVPAASLPVSTVAVSAAEVV